jgi:hypothetical protein
MAGNPGSSDEEIEGGRKLTTLAESYINEEAKSAR